MGRCQPVVRKRDIDGGWAWVVLVSSSFQQVFYGLNYATGLFNAMFLEEFGKSRQATAWIGSVQISIFCLSAPLSSLLMSRLGNTLTLVVGCLIGFFGFFFAYFAQSFLALFLTFGVMVGWLYDISGGYELTFYTTGVLYILGALSMLLIPIISRDMRSDNQSTAET